MSLTIGMVVHIASGGAGILSGFASFMVRKGAPTHILIGRIYVVSMIIMALGGFYYAYIRSVNITMLASCLTIYLVITSWLTMQRSIKSALFHRYGPLYLGLPVLSYGLVLSWNALNGVTDELGSFSVPSVKYYEFTLVLCIAFAYDLALAAGKKLQRNEQINRHIWRMTFPLYIACSALFEGQAKVFPESLQHTFWLSLPEKLALLLMVYWLFREQITTIKDKCLLRVP